jgi:hypothetical protein
LFLLLNTRGRCGAKVDSSPLQASEPTGDYVLLHRDTSTAIYAIHASEVEIHKANAKLRGFGIIIG